jgi:hypothetical protein
MVDAGGRGGKATRWGLGYMIEVLVILPFNYYKISCLEHGYFYIIPSQSQMKVWYQ